MAEREDEREYNPADKFGIPEDAPQTYLLEDGREVGHAEFLEQVKKVSRRRRALPALSLLGRPLISGEPMISGDHAQTDPKRPRG